LTTDTGHVINGDWRNFDDMAVVMNRCVGNAFGNLETPGKAATNWTEVLMQKYHTTSY